MHSLCSDVLFQLSKQRIYCCTVHWAQVTLGVLVHSTVEGITSESNMT